MWHKNEFPRVPDIRTALPGPQSRALIESDEEFMSPSYTRVYPLAVKRGLGAVIEDLDGNVFLDFTAGIAVCATGHCHPRVVDAIQRQSTSLLHMSGTDFYNVPQRDLAQKLAEIAPGDKPKRVFFTNSGAESIEAAFKLARYHTGRQQVIAFLGAFHGRTMGALSLTASKRVQRHKFGPLVPGVTHVPYPDVYRRPAGMSPEQLTANTLRYIEQDLFTKTVPPDEVAAIFVEPIQGEGGYVVPPDDFLPRLKALCERHGILLVADEVQSGMGRTGKMFAVEHWGVVPDILCLAKGIASGLPLGAIVAPADIMNWERGSHANTFGGNPIACAAALETIALLQESLTENAMRVGTLLLDGLKNLQGGHPLIGDVRGKGLMVAIDLVRNRQSKEPAIDERNALIDRCFQKGLLLLGCGASAVRFCPPLVIDKTHVETALRILDEVLSDLSRPAAMKRTPQNDPQVGGSAPSSIVAP